MRILLLSPQSIVETIDFLNPNIEALNSRFVDTINTPDRIKATARYPMGFILSLKITSANKIENTVSPLARRDVSVMLKP